MPLTAIHKIRAFSTNEEKPPKGPHLFPLFKTILDQHQFGIERDYVRGSFARSKVSHLGHFDNVLSDLITGVWGPPKHTSSNHHTWQVATARIDLRYEKDHENVYDTITYSGGLKAL